MIYIKHKNTSTIFDKMSSLNSDSDFILDLSAERVWLSSIYATKMMFIQCDKYRRFDSNPFKLKFILQMSCWSELVVVPITKRLVKYHKVPSVFENIFEEKTEQLLSEGNLSCGLHLYMLVLASNHMLEKLVEGVCPKTGNEIQEWMKLMKKIKEENNKIFKHAGKQVKLSFCEMLQKHHDLSSDISFDNVEEHPFFNHQMVFLHIAHLVLFYSKNQLERTIPSIKEAKLCPIGLDMMVWEKHCGKLCKGLFDLDSHGLLLLERNQLRDKKFCTGILLPYSLYYDDKKLVSKDGIPSIPNMHKKVIEVFRNHFSKLSTNDILPQWDYQSSVTSIYFDKTCEYLETQKKTFSNRQKVQRHLLKKKKNGSFYTPIIPQNHWQRDTFCLGCHSMMTYASSVRIKIRIEHVVENNSDEEFSSWELDDSSDSSTSSAEQVNEVSLELEGSIEQDNGTSVEQDNETSL